MGWEQGGGNWAMDMLGQRNQATSMWGDYLKQMQGLQQGRISPTELPQFKTYMQELGRLATITDANLLRDLTAGGVSGGALGDLMTRSSEGRLGQMGNYLNQFMSQVYGQVPQAAQQGLDLWMKILQMAMQEKQRSFQKAATKKEQQTGATTSMFGSAMGGMAGGLSI